VGCGGGGGGVTDGRVEGSIGGDAVELFTSPKATTTPELELSVFRGLPNWG
jgi:hypothetical protein